MLTNFIGYWRAPFLRQTKMHTDMLTEDIDSALRSLAANACIVHDTNVVSYELAPTQFSAFWKQRLRWAQGWAQASLKHCIMTFNKPQEGKRDFSVRFGILSLLLIRELSYYLVTQYCCLVFSIILLDFPKSPMALARLVFFEYPASEWFFIIRYVLGLCASQLEDVEHSHIAVQRDLPGCDFSHHRPCQKRIHHGMECAGIRRALSYLPDLHGGDWSLRPRQTNYQIRRMESDGSHVKPPAGPFSSSFLERCHLSVHSA